MQGFIVSTISVTVAVVMVSSQFLILLLLLPKDVASAEYLHHHPPSENLSPPATATGAAQLRGMATSSNHANDALVPRSLQVSGGVGTIVSWRLINATAGNKGEILIAPLLNETVIDLTKYPANQQLAIDVVTSTNSGPVGAVRFQYDNRTNYRTESTAPFALCGDTGVTFKACPKLILVGTATMTATPYSLENATGIKGLSSKLSFQIIKTTTSTKTPTKAPTKTPTKAPTKTPTKAPTKTPTKAPTKTPTTAPMNPPTTPPTKAPTTAPMNAPTTAPESPSQWIVVNPNALIGARHEACFVMVGRKAYLLAGRDRKPVNIYDPVTRIWTNGTMPPIQIHHTQCVAYTDSIWMVSSWTGGFPMERNTDKIYIYNTTTNTWSTKAGLPEPRRRGGAAAVLVGDKIYVSHGNRGGHETANYSISLGWLDYYDISEDRWYTNLTDAPHSRDHVGGALVNGRICVAGGRDGGDVDFFAKVILPTDCYDPATDAWSVEANIPNGRAGASYGTTCDGKLMIAGGEGGSKTANKEAWSNVDVFDGTSWTAVDSLNIARHGSGLAVDCVCRQIHVASGAATQGGRYEITSVETFFPNGVDAACIA